MGMDEDMRSILFLGMASSRIFTSAANIQCLQTKKRRYFDLHNEIQYRSVKQAKECYDHYNGC